MRRLSRFLAPYWRWAALAPLLMVLEVAMDLMQPRLVQRIVDEGIATSDLAVVVSTGAWMVGVAVIGLVGGMGCAVYAVLAAQHFGADLRSALFRQVQALSYGNLDRLETGSLITRLTNDVTQVQEVVMLLLRVMVRVPLLLVGSLIMAVLTSAQLALLFVVLIPAVVGVLLWTVNRTYPLFGRVQRRLDALNTVLQENLAGVRVVKAFVREPHEGQRFGRANDRLMEENIIALRASGVATPLIMLAVNAGVVASVWFGGLRVDAGGLQVGQLIAFINYLMQTLMALMAVSSLLVRLSRAEASAERITELLASEPEVRNRPGALATFAPQGRVAFEDVGFSYSRAGQDAVLRNISFVAEPGQTVALLGATGSGKSSLVNLVPRFYDVTAGRVTIDGVDVRDIDEAALRATIGVALQEAVLFSGTVRDNIRYGRPEATEAEVVAAAETAQAHEFISRLPGGYDAVLGQRGVNLSGGQKQRIAIARALLVRPAVLILDDSTSAVDVETESLIQGALAKGALTRRHESESAAQKGGPGGTVPREKTSPSMTYVRGSKGPTRLVVAQRVSAVAGADTILILDDGRIVAQGRHEELLAGSPIYREIYESQLEHGTITHGAD